MKDQAKTKSVDYTKAFETFEKEQGLKQPQWLRLMQRDALDSFHSLGFPTLKDEVWKYTDVRLIAQSFFEPNRQIPNGQFSKNNIDTVSFGMTDVNRLVFVDGVFSEKLSTTNELKGVLVSNFQSALRTHPQILEQYFGKNAGFREDAFVALNTAFVYDGLILHVPDGTEIEKPIHVVFISSGKENSVLSSPRNLVVVGKNSRLNLLESHVSFGRGNDLVNSVTEIFLNENSELGLCRVEEESPDRYRLTSTHVVQQRGSKFSSAQVTFGSKISRNAIRVFLEGEGSECSLDGLYVTRGDEHVDHSTFVSHSKPRGVSRQLYKGILDGASSAAFTGKVYVEKGAEKTDAQQTNKNLLLSENASADTRPQLEILADDVKCTHGAAVGHLDEEAVFYLKSRGIDSENAQKMLTFGFACEVIDRIKLSPVRETINRLVHERFDTASFGRD